MKREEHPLIAACRSNNPSAVEEIVKITPENLQKMFTIRTGEQKKPAKVSALFFSVFIFADHVVAYLLTRSDVDITQSVQQGHPLSHKTNYGYGALSQTVYTYQDSVAQLITKTLIEKNAAYDPYVANHLAHALETAVLSPNNKHVFIAIAQQLIDTPYNILLTDPLRINSWELPSYIFDNQLLFSPPLLRTAVENNQYEIAEFLIKHCHALPNQRFHYWNNQTTTFFFAVKNNKSAFVDLFIHLKHFPSLNDLHSLIRNGYMYFVTSALQNSLKIDELRKNYAKIRTQLLKLKLQFLSLPSNQSAPFAHP